MPIRKAGVEPQLQPRQRVQQRAHHSGLGRATEQRVEVGHVQLARRAVLAQNLRDRHRVAARAQPRHDRPVGLAVAAHRTHNLTLHEIDDGDELHDVERTSGQRRGEPMMQQSFVREHLNGGGPWSQTSR